jgi:hypothetical protein
MKIKQVSSERIGLNKSKKSASKQSSNSVTPMMSPHDANMIINLKSEAMLGTIGERKLKKQTKTRVRFNASPFI